MPDYITEQYGTGSFLPLVRAMQASAMFALIVVALAGASIAQAAWQDLAALRPVAEAFVLQQLHGTPGRIEVSVGWAEPRLRLAACDRPAAFAPPGARYWGNATVGVRCEGANSWTLYLPVSVSVKGPVVVTARALAKGETLGAGDVSVQELDLTQLPTGAAYDPEQVVGRVTKSPLAGGTVVRPNALRAPPVVRQGEAIRLAYAGEGFEVHGAGHALGAAGVGEDVEVRAQSGRVLRGRVRARGWVVVR